MELEVESQQCTSLLQSLAAHAVLPGTPLRLPSYGSSSRTLRISAGRSPASASVSGASTTRTTHTTAIPMSARSSLHPSRRARRRVPDHRTGLRLSGRWPAPHGASSHHHRAHPAEPGPARRPEVDKGRAVPADATACANADGQGFTGDCALYSSSAGRCRASSGARRPC